MIPNNGCEKIAKYTAITAKLRFVYCIAVLQRRKVEENFSRKKQYWLIFNTYTGGWILVCWMSHELLRGIILKILYSCVNRKRYYQFQWNSKFNIFTRIIRFIYRVKQNARSTATFQVTNYYGYLDANWLDIKASTAIMDSVLRFVYWTGFNTV